MVSRRVTGGIPVERTYLAFDEYPELYAAEVPAAGPAGSLLVYRPTPTTGRSVLRAPARPRFLLHIAFKRPGTDWLGFQSWPSAAEGMDWYRFVRHASVRQLSRAGFPRPGRSLLDRGDARRGGCPLPAARHDAVEVGHDALRFR